MNSHINCPARGESPFDWILEGWRLLRLPDDGDALVVPGSCGFRRC
jgi:hypothetical protein